MGGGDERRDAGPDVWAVTDAWYHVGAIYSHYGPVDVVLWVWKFGQSGVAEWVYAQAEDWCDSKVYYGD